MSGLWSKQGKDGSIALQQKVKVLAKLYDSGCKTEKDLKALSLQSILKIPDISVSDSGGFPTGLKWEFANKQKADMKYVV